MSALNFLRIESARPGSSPEYFAWLGTILSKLVLLQLSIEIEQLIEQKNFDQAMFYMRLLSHQYCSTSAIIDEPSIRANLIYWLSELNIPLPEILKPEALAIVESINSKKPIA
jgi:hypothetical protein